MQRQRQRQRKKVFFNGFLVVVFALIVVAIPNKGFSTLIAYQENLVFESSLFKGKVIANVDVGVYDAVGDLPIGGISLASDEYLYTYEVTNPGILPITLNSFSIYRDDGAPINEIGSVSGNVVTSVESTSLLFSRLGLSAGKSDILYLVSPGLPVFVTASFVSSAGSSNSANAPLILAPDPPPPAVPEPSTLLLVGVGLIGSAIFRKRVLRKKS